MSLVLYRRRFSPINVLSHGSGTITGVTRKLSIIEGRQKISLLFRDTLKLLRTTNSDINGNYSFNNVNLSNDYVLICTDQNKILKSEIIDKISI